MTLPNSSQRDAKGANICMWRETLAENIRAGAFDGFLAQLATTPLGTVRRGIKLIPLEEACDRRGISRRSWNYNKGLLPPAIALGEGNKKRWMIAEHELEEMLAGIIDARAGACRGSAEEPGG